MIMYREQSQLCLGEREKQKCEQSCAGKNPLNRKKDKSALVYWLVRTDLELRRQREAIMYITVKYGQNESLLCNPSCAVVNLLSSIKKRTGFTNLTLELSDETGLIKDLDVHKSEYATSFLSSQGTYILLQKNPVQISDPTQSNTAPAQFTYTVLLEHIEDLFPDFHLHIAEVEEQTLKPRKLGSKTPTPAGRLLSKPAKKSHHRTLGSRRK